MFSLAADGRPVPAGHIPVGGRTPRGFGLSPDGAWIVVALQNSDQVVVLRRDAATGLAVPVGQPARHRQAGVRSVRALSANPLHRFGGMLHSLGGDLR